jgi:hypothetical protein
LGRPPHLLAPGPAAAACDPLDDDDFQLALYCCYELHYRGLPGAPEGWEWEPSLLRWRGVLERRFEDRLLAEVPLPGVVAGDVVPALWVLAGDASGWAANAGGGTAGAPVPSGPSLSGWVLANGELHHARELAVHRSAYQLKEADPHTWAIPRLDGRAKAAMVAIQADEYGNGTAARMHSSLFAKTMEALGLDSRYGAYLDYLPAATLATINLISLLGLHRRLRGALVGHLALFEMTSVVPMGRYDAWLGRLGVAEEGRAFYAVHVAADAVHRHVAADELVAGLLESDPELGAQVLWGAQVLSAVEARFSARLLGAWEAGRPLLLPGARAVAA